MSACSLASTVSQPLELVEAMMATFHSQILLAMSTCQAGQHALYALTQMIM